jgi:2-methylisocitrate lyase-like PEP mutase family enzyme
MPARPDTATLFHRLHQGPDVLLLPNAWDAGSARLIESLGAKAIATTSAGVCWALGYQDGTMVPPAALRAAVAAIARVITVPLSVDIEGGYAADPAAVGESVAGVVEAGAVGVNIEDGAGAPDLLCAKIAAAKQAASRLGVDLFVNARTDVYLRQLAPAATRVAETLARAKRYAASGADSIFVPGVTAADEIRALAAIDRPLAVMARPALPPAAELATLGVRRLSAGSSLAEQAMARTAALTEGFLRDGRSDVVCDGAMPYPKANALFGAR